MNDILCFVLDGHKLYLEKVLVSFNDDPLFYTCISDKNESYIVLCVSFDEGIYIIAKAPIGRMLTMLDKTIDMRSMFLDAGYFWEVIAGDSPEEDDVSCERIDAIDLSVLPYKDEYYSAIDEDDKLYVKKTRKEMANVRYDDSCI